MSKKTEKCYICGAILCTKDFIDGRAFMVKGKFACTKHEGIREEYNKFRQMVDGIYGCKKGKLICIRCGRGGLHIKNVKQLNGIVVCNKCSKCCECNNEMDLVFENDSEDKIILNCSVCSNVEEIGNISPE